MNWTTTRLKHLCVDAGQYGLNISAHNYAPNGHRLIRTSDIDELGRLRSSDQGVYVDVSLDARHELKEGDLLLSRSGTIGRAMLLGFLGEPSTYAGYLVRFRPRPSAEPRFLAYVAASRGFQAAIEADAVTATIQNFNAERYANIEITVPPIDEQRRIADFLDAETARIESLDELAASAMGLLAERRRAFVERVIFDDGAPRQKLFRSLQLLRDGTHQPPPRTPAGVPLLTARNVSTGVLQLTDQDTFVSPEDAKVLEASLRPKCRDVLLSVKGTIGAVSIVPPEFPRAVLDRNLALLRPQPALLNEWLVWVLRTRDLQEQMRLSVAAAAQPGLPLGVIRELRIPLVSNETQTRQLCMIETLDRQLGDLESKIQLQRHLLAERRQALVTAAVTGQIDVSTAHRLSSSEGVSA